MKTTAAILVELARPLIVDEIDVPALKAGQVLVEIAYSGACGTQVMEARGLKGEDRWLPHCLGHEATGVVVDLGPGVGKVKPGDRVVLSWIKGAGIEAGGAIYDWGGRKVNAGGVTTFQRHAVVSENRLTPLPKAIAMDIGVMLGCAGLTGMGSVFNVARVTPGDSVAVFGVGGVGLNAVMAASLAGASPVIAIDPNAERRVLALACGATHAIDPRERDIVPDIRECAPTGLDVAIEATGVPAVMATALRAVRAQGGRAVVIGNARHGARLDLDPALFNQGKSLMGTWGGDSLPDRDVPRLGRLFAGERFPLRRILSSPYRLDEINQALDDLAAGRIGRPLIDMNRI